MGIFRRDRPPAWSPFTRRSDHDRFIGLVEDTLRSLDAPHRAEEEGRSYVIERSDAEPGRIMLDNLAQTCAHAPEGDWPTIVRRHLTTVLDPDPLEDLGPEQLREAVRVRLYPTEGLAELDIALPRRPVAEGIAEVVVTDTPETVALVAADQYEQLGLDPDALFALGRDNLRKYEQVSLDPVDAGPAALLVAESDSFYTASWALLLDELTDVPPAGALVAVPTRHVLLAHPLTDATAVEAISLMLVTAARMHADTPGSLSPSLYWWRDGELRELAGAFDGEQVRFTPPDDFVAVLEELL